MRISEVSRLTGASAKAIRLYEARGLLPAGATPEPLWRAGAGLSRCASPKSAA
ncbi:hypothetical protein C7E17_10685 [Stenotrophomonas maltophilia]|nr:hypothetical protein C7E17_10685 [Stenotrophomonas maltophilia]